MITFPRRGRGRQTVQAEERYQDDVRAFCEEIKQIASRLDFQISSRGWCYQLEGENIITKGDFDAAQTLINDCRKSGLLPIDICSTDDAREFISVESLDYPNIEDEAQLIIRSVTGWVRRYQPVSFWHDKPVYIQMMVEKIDLKSLFAPVCERYYVPLANGRGWSDLHSRADMMRRFAEHEAAGRQCVLLYCGDHDPGGLAISDAIRSNMAELTPAIGWNPSNLIIDRFGLNHDFIMANNLTWIDNLVTSSKKRLDDSDHPDHFKPYVQDYLAAYGARKVEANALVVRPTEGRQLCQDAIVKWLGDASSPERFAKQMEPMRKDLAAELSALLKGGAY